MSFFRFDHNAYIMTNILEYINCKVSKMGASLVYAVMLLFYAYQEPDTPKWAKSTIIGAIGYLISPIDSIPDLTPFLGFTDDMGIVMFGLVTIACYITEDVRVKAKTRLLNLLPRTEDEIFAEIDSRL